MFQLRSVPSFQMIAVEGERRLHCICKGPEGAPLVLYDAGAFGNYSDGWWIQEELSQDHRVCLYDRAGMGWSDPVPKGGNPDPDWHVEDMRRLKSSLGHEEPFVLIGHSMAGIRLHAFANAYPDELLGLVFVDAARPQSIEPERVQSFVTWIERGLTLSTFFAQIGLTGGAAYVLPDELGLSAEPKKDKRYTISSVRHHKATKAEMLAAVKSFSIASWRTDTAAEQLPVFVFSNSEDGGANASVAQAAKENTGLGGMTALPEESHVSLLNKKNAALIAQDVRKITSQKRK